MLSWIIFIDICFITIILLISVYLDLKFRKISNRFLRTCFCFSIFLNTVEMVFFYSEILLILLLKILFFCIIFLFSFVLFSLKIIGGSDGKLFLLIFSVHPIRYLNYYFVVFFFFFFSLFFLIMFFINLVHNSMKNNSYAFGVFYIFDVKLSILRKLFIKSFYKFFALSKLTDFEGEKIYIDYLFIVYNNQNRKLQFLGMYRPPLTLICFISYFLILFLIIVI